MKSTTNKYQRNYMFAKAHKDALYEAQLEMERNYIIKSKIVNKNGEVPTAIYCIDDEAVFDCANHQFSEMPEVIGNWEAQQKAEKELQAAEDALIAYGLGLAPAKAREILRKSCAENYTTRKKVLDLALRLDISTVPA